MFLADDIYSKVNIFVIGSLLEWQSIKLTTCFTESRLSISQSSKASDYMKTSLFQRHGIWNVTFPSYKFKKKQ